jgi:hypothetical protein
MEKGTLSGVRARGVDENRGSEISDEGTSAGGPNIKAEDNPWYLLATLYGEPKSDDEKLQVKNRTLIPLTQVAL